MTDWLEISTEGVRFASERLRQNIETQQAMLGCKTPADVLQLQSAYYRNAIEQYTAETNRLFGMMFKAGSQYGDLTAWTHARTFDDVPL